MCCQWRPHLRVCWPWKKPLCASNSTNNATLTWYFRHSYQHPASTSSVRMWNFVVAGFHISVCVWCWFCCTNIERSSFIICCCICVCELVLVLFFFSSVSCFPEGVLWYLMAEKSRHDACFTDRRVTSDLVSFAVAVFVSHLTCWPFWRGISSVWGPGHSFFFVQSFFFFFCIQIPVILFIPSGWQFCLLLCRSAETSRKPKHTLRLLSL